MKDYTFSIRQIATEFFDHSVRIEKMIWLASQGDSFCKDLKELIEDDPEEFAKLLNLDIKADLEEDAILSLLARSDRNGFLILAATPLPTSFFQNGYSFSWGYYTTQWFYFESFSPKEVAKKLIEWRESVVERERKNAAKEEKA